MKIAFGRKDEDLDGCKIQLINPLKIQRQKRENDSLYMGLCIPLLRLCSFSFRSVSLQSTTALPTSANITLNHSPNPSLYQQLPAAPGSAYISIPAHVSPSPRIHKHLLVLLILFHNTPEDYTVLPNMASSTSRRCIRDLPHH